VSSVPTSSTLVACSLEKANEARSSRKKRSTGTAVASGLLAHELDRRPLIELNVPGGEHNADASGTDHTFDPVFPGDDFAWRRNARLVLTPSAGCLLRRRTQAAVDALVTHQLGPVRFRASSVANNPRAPLRNKPGLSRVVCDIGSLALARVPL
jgi:hypothetical protein